jgi:peptidyl-tRNA hydrolase
VIDYVLRRAPKEEEDKILASIDQSIQALPTFLEQGAERAMNGLHGKK